MKSSSERLYAGALGGFSLSISMELKLEKIVHCRRNLLTGRVAVPGHVRDSLMGECLDVSFSIDFVLPLVMRRSNLLHLCFSHGDGVATFVALS